MALPLAGWQILALPRGSVGQGGSGAHCRVRGGGNMAVVRLFRK